MELLLYILSALCMLVGLAGCILPMLPGPPLAWLGMLLLHFTDRVDFTVTELVVSALVVIATVVLDYITPMIGTKKFGGGKYGNWGCMIGTVVGLFFMPLGLILGPFIGAVIGELIAGKPMRAALKAGFGSFVGFLFGTLIKLAVCIYFIVRFIMEVV
ncbi:MAG: DUF456 domain-containing protein [Bacteroidetes bacterium]|uniref:DUF456 domain-containing protein n=1 Tax=Candidatus Limisoma faecipullorum TaxID=2840854 RepID=A0A9D9IMX6_9BACT|nr:DUF456 domain-containing protein [Candidatus Limisoma faecipullorum]